MAKVPESHSSTNYFAYGSNLSSTQMGDRCPSSFLIGVARLRGWHWIINERGYANIVETASPEAQDLSESSVQTQVFGLVYALSLDDEASLDGYEGVPFAYTKEHLRIELKRLESPHDEDLACTDVSNFSGSRLETINGLVYLDRARTQLSQPNPEYVARMRRAVSECAQIGVPRQWLREVVGQHVDLGDALAGLKLDSV